MEVADCKTEYYYKNFGVTIFLLMRVFKQKKNNIAMLLYDKKSHEICREENFWRRISYKEKR